MSSESTDGVEGRPKRSTIAVGKVDRSSTDVRLVESDEGTSEPFPDAFPGPWSVRAVVWSPGPHLKVEP